MRSANELRRRRRRSLLVASALLVLTAVMLVAFVLRLARSPEAKVQLGDPVFEVGNAQRWAERIERDDVPLLFQDLLGRSRDIWVVHSGDDPAVGWSAFKAQLRGQPRSCVLRWLPAVRRFEDPCSKRRVATGDVFYDARVGDDGVLRVDLNTEQVPKAASTTTSVRT